MLLLLLLWAVQQARHRRAPAPTPAALGLSLVPTQAPWKNSAFRRGELSSRNLEHLRASNCSGLLHLHHKDTGIVWANKEQEAADTNLFYRKNLLGILVSTFSKSPVFQLLSIIFWCNIIRQESFQTLTATLHVDGSDAVTMGRLRGEDEGRVLLGGGHHCLQSQL